MMEANAELLARAQSLFSAKRPAEAERIYLQLLTQTHVIDFEYDEWLKGVADCYRMLDRPREAGWVYFYLHAFERAAEVFTVAQSPLEVARMQELQARRSSGEAAKRLFGAAAKSYAEAGRHVQAAICHAQADDHRAERRAWERVLRDPRLRGRNYEQALVHFNLGLAAGKDGDKDEGNRHQIVDDKTLKSKKDRRDRALQIVRDAGARQ